MVAENSLRFCVADLDKNKRAASWKVWSPYNKNDIYVAGRELKGSIKVSLHQSNQWHLAYSPDFYEQSVPENESDTGRFIHTWKKPADIGPGVTIALRIVTPWTAVSTNLQQSKKVHYLKSPLEGRANEIGIIITAPTTKVSNWPGKNSVNSELIGTYTLPNSSVVWAVHWDIECPDFSGLSGQAHLFRGVKKSNVSGSLRAMIFGDHEDGSKVLYDTIGHYSKDGA